MDTTKIIEMLSYTFPALITGGVAFYFFQMHVKNEEGRRRYLLHKESQKQSLPLRLQAYERMTLFLERINLSKILIRVAPISNNPDDYANFVIAQIEQELEHNLVQQVYISDECWDIILKAKSATIQIIRNAAKKAEINNADQLRELVLNQTFEKGCPSMAALSYLKSEVKDLW